MKKIADNMNFEDGVDDYYIVNTWIKKNLNFSKKKRQKSKSERLKQIFRIKYNKLFY